MGVEGLFNPASLEPDDLLYEFTARGDLLGRLVDVVRGNKRGQAQQHVLLVGSRGMGKTMTLLALAYSVERDAELTREWGPVVLPEELYGVGDLADFWLILAERLLTDGEQDPSAVDTLRFEAPSDLEERALSLCLAEIDRRGRRLLLCLENLHDVFEAISDDEAQHRLRALLMEDDRIMIAGSATSYFGAVAQADAPFFEFFRPFQLPRLDVDETFEVLRTLAQRNDEQTVLRILDEEPQRVSSLHVLTGGNPRLVKAIYRLLREGGAGEARRDLERLLDDCTPYFKHRIESLSREQRRVFDAVARSWDPVSVRDLESALRRKSNVISTYLKRLGDEGFVEESPVSTDRRKAYQVAERFYNIYYLMRFSRVGRRRLEWLTRAMQVLYSPDDYRSWAQRTLAALGDGPASGDRRERSEFLCALVSSAEDPTLRQELGRQAVTAAFEAHQLSSLHELLDRETTRFALGEDESNIVAFLAGLDAETQATLGYRPDDAEWWLGLRPALHEHGLYGESETACRRAIDLEPEFVDAWIGLGWLLASKLSRPEEAEAAYRRSLELNPDCPLTWNNLALLLAHEPSRVEEAEAAYRRAIALERRSVPLSGLARLLHWEGRAKAAAPLAAEAVRLDPTSTWALRGFLRVCAEDANAWWQVLRVVLAVPSEQATTELFEFAIHGLGQVFAAGLATPEDVLAVMGTQEPGSWLEQLELSLRAWNEPAVLKGVAPERRVVAEDLLAALRPSEES